MAPPQLRFEKLDEARFANELSRAQRAAAELEPKITRLYEILKTGEQDREREITMRWKAGYDLAMGRTLAEMAQKVVETLDFTEEAALDHRVRHLKIPLREVPPDELTRARETIESQPQPAWADEAKTRVDRDWMAAASVYSVHLARERDPNLDYETQVFRIGDTAIVGLPGEPFVEGQLQIKLNSPTYPTYVAHCTSHYVGYLPTREASTRGGHEANMLYTYWAKLATGSLETVADNAVEMLREMFPAASEGTQ